MIKNQHNNDDLSTTFGYVRDNDYRTGVNREIKMSYLRRIQPILAISISVLVILFCAGVTIGLWIVVGRIIPAAITTLDVVDRSAQVMRDGIDRVDTGLVTLRDPVSTVAQASEQLAQNVNDQGLVLTLLPPAKEQELTAAVQLVQENFVAIQDLLAATAELLQALDKMPLVNIPTKGLSTVEALQNKLDEVTTQVMVLKTNISEFRSRVAARITNITTAANLINTGIDEMRADLDLVDSELNTIQTQTKNLQRILPGLLYLSLTFATICAIWVVYSQVIMINRAVVQFRSFRSHAVATPAYRAEETKLEAEQTIYEETERISDQYQQGSDGNSGEEAEDSQETQIHETE